MIEENVDPVEAGEEATPLAGAEEAPETQEVEASEEQVEEVVEQPKKPTAKDRIDELTRLRRDAERDAEYWRAKALATAQPEPAPVQQPEAAPDPASYESGEFDQRYIRDLARFEARQEYAQQRAAEDEERRARSAAEKWNDHIKRGSEKLPDFEEIVLRGAERNAWPCTPDMAEALRDSDLAAELAYHLASNPAEAGRIARLSPVSQVREIGRLEAKLSEPVKPTAKTATDAPSPAPQVRGAGGRFTVAPDTDDFGAFEKQYGG